MVINYGVASTDLQTTVSFHLIFQPTQLLLFVSTDPLSQTDWQCTAQLNFTHRVVRIGSAI